MYNIYMYIYIYIEDAYRSSQKHRDRQRPYSRVAQFKVCFSCSRRWMSESFAFLLRSRVLSVLIKLCYGDYYPSNRK